MLCLFGFPRSWLVELGGGLVGLIWYVYCWALQWVGITYLSPWSNWKIFCRGFFFFFIFVPSPYITPPPIDHSMSSNQSTKEAAGWRWAFRYSRFEDLGFSLPALNWIRRKILKKKKIFPIKVGFQYYNAMNGWVNVLSSTAVDVWDSIFHLLSPSVMIVVLPPYLVQFLIAAWPSSQKKT